MPSKYSQKRRKNKPKSNGGLNKRHTPSVGGARAASSSAAASSSEAVGLFDDLNQNSIDAEESGERQTKRRASGGAGGAVDPVFDFLTEQAAGFEFEDPFEDDLVVASSDEEAGDAAADDDDDDGELERGMRERFRGTEEDFSRDDDGGEDDDDDDDPEPDFHHPLGVEGEDDVPVKEPSVKPPLRYWTGDDSSSSTAASSSSSSSASASSSSSRKGGRRPRLEHDPKAYEMFHRLNMEWPCMSFDWVADSLGVARQRFPHTAYMVAGTQAARADRNRLLVLRLSDMHRTKHDLDDSDTDDDDQLLEDLDDDPVLDARSIRLDSGVNRVRSCPQRSSVVAVWTEAAELRMYNVATQLTSLQSKEPSGNLNVPPQSARPLQANRHRQEGYAMAWSRSTAGRFVAGDCAAGIALWQPTPGGAWKIDSGACRGHTDSVEDLQWSPKDDPIFASASVDKTIRIWDSRSPLSESVLTIQAHESDVNVLSWNSLATHLLASGSDDTTFKIWDLRQVRSQTLSESQPLHNPLGTLRWHKDGITSIDWHPTAKSCIAVSSADDTISLWDMSVKADDEEDKQATLAAGLNIPPQLLFLHHGQEQIKEIHWHSQIPSVIASTSATGFHIFKTINV